MWESKDQTLDINYNVAELWLFLRCVRRARTQAP
jgi:hypothetical protein